MALSMPGAAQTLLASLANRLRGAAPPPAPDAPVNGWDRPAKERLCHAFQADSLQAVQARPCLPVTPPTRTRLKQVRTALQTSTLFTCIACSMTCPLATPGRLRSAACCAQALPLTPAAAQRDLALEQRVRRACSARSRQPCSRRSAVLNAAPRAGRAQLPAAGGVRVSRVRRRRAGRRGRAGRAGAAVSGRPGHRAPAAVLAAARGAPVRQPASCARGPGGRSCRPQQAPAAAPGGGSPPL